VNPSSSQRDTARREQWKGVLTGALAGGLGLALFGITRQPSLRALPFSAMILGMSASFAWSHAHSSRPNKRRRLVILASATTIALVAYWLWLALD
jgi:hypothetical protein